MNALSPTPMPPPTFKSSASSELTLAQARAAVAGWLDLPDQTRSDLGSALAAVAKIAQRYPDLCGGAPPEQIVLNCRSLNQLLYAGSARSAGFEPGRFTTIISLIRHVLRRLGLHAPDVSGSAHLSPAWRALHAAVSSRYRQLPLRGFMTFCSIQGIAPAAVGQDALTAYEAWCRDWTIDEDITGKIRRTAANWDWARANVPGWPDGALTRPQVKEQYALPLEAYPASFQQDVDNYAARLAGTDDTFLDEDVFSDAVGSGAASPRRGHRPLAPRSIATRRTQIRLAAAALVRQGMDPHAITSLRDLVVPAERSVSILKFHRERLRSRKTARGETVDPASLRSSLLTGIAEMLRQVAKFHCRLDEAAVTRLTELGRKVSSRSQVTMTPKNRERLRRLIEPRARALLLHLPDYLITQAKSPETPTATGARLALYATALEILLICPIRRDNLATLDTTRGFRRDRAGKINRLQIPSSKVKNRCEIDWPWPAGSATVIETYITRYRPLLVQGENTYLFPGQNGRHRDPSELATALSELIEREIGVPVNVHLLRHFAVWNFLSNNPGQYEIARQALGHRNIATTIAFYSGLEADASASHFDATVLRERDKSRAVAKQVFGRRPSPRQSSTARPGALS